jgi:hypothetical protein
MPPPMGIFAFSKAWFMSKFHLRSLPPFDFSSSIITAFFTYRDSNNEPLSETFGECRGAISTRASSLKKIMLFPIKTV